MNPRLLVPVLCSLPLLLSAAPGESEIRSELEALGTRLTINDEGHITKIFSGGKPEIPLELLQQFGELEHLEAISMNMPIAGNDEWGFLKDLPNLQQLTIWHCKTISCLEPFSDLGIEGLTVGGSMGLRDLNKDDSQAQRDTVLTLHNLPNLKRLNLYHMPLAPDDAHLEHIASEFPTLEDLKIDFAAPRGSETSITPDGLRHLKKLPLTVISMEHVETFTPDHMTALAEIETLEAVLMDCRKKPFDTAPLEAAMKEARPNLEIVVAGEGDKGPPRRGKTS